MATAHEGEEPSIDELGADGAADSPPQPLDAPCALERLLRAYARHVRSLQVLEASARQLMQMRQEERDAELERRREAAAAAAAAAAEQRRQSAARLLAERSVPGGTPRQAAAAAGGASGAVGRLRTRL